MNKCMGFILAICCAAGAQSFSGGASVKGSVSIGAQLPTLTLVGGTSSASTIEESFTTLWPATPTMSCGTSPGVYTVTSVDTGVAGELQQIVAELNASTTYYCQVSVTNAAGTVSNTFSRSTTAIAPITPAVSMSLGTITTYNSINASNQGNGDTYYNAQASNGTTYLTNDDAAGYTISGLPVAVSSSMALLTMLTNSPISIVTSNPLLAFGPAGHDGGDGNTQKDSGLFTVGGKMLILGGRQPTTGSFVNSPQYDGAMMMSPDNGHSWANFQNPTVFNYPGSPNSPINASMWGTSPTSYAGATFVMGCSDDGTLGYTIACNQTDNRDAFVYILGNDTNYPGGSGCGADAHQNDYYLMRVPRAKIANLNPADYQAFTGGDGNVDANWSSTLSNAVSILHECAELGFANVQYVPAKNSYVMLTYYAPNGLNVDKATTVWQGWSASHPWGPWTVIYTQNWNSGTTPPGAYNPIILGNSILSGTTPTIMFTGDYGIYADYQMYLATLTIN